MLTATESFHVDSEKLFPVLGFTPHEGQKFLYNTDYRFKVVVAGRRWGKSLGAARWAERFILVPGTRGWVVSKTYDLTRKVIREIYKDLVVSMMHPAGLQLVRNVQTGPILLEFPWGSTVEGKSAEHPESLLGEGLDWLVFDEFAKCKETVWDYYLRPTLTDRLGKALFISTPNGYNWGFNFYQRGNDPLFPEWGSFKSPSWANPHLPPEDLDEARRTISEAAFQQEYGADFTLMAGQVYKEFDESVHVYDDEVLELDPEWERYRSIDFGYENPFAALFIAVDEEERVIIYGEYYMRHRTVEKHAGWLNEEEESHGEEFPGYEYTTADPSGASARATLLEKGIPTVAVRSDVLHGLEAVRQSLRLREDGTTGLLVSSRCVQTIREFNLYSYREDRLSEEPEKKHDHTMDALRYFIVNWRRGYITQRPGRYA